MPIRTTRTLILATLSVLCVSLVVAVLWAIGSSAGGRDRFSSLDIAPRDAAVYIAINTAPDSSQWIAFADTLDALGAKTPASDAINDALAEFDLVWQDDILPLAGDEAYIAVLGDDILGDTTWVGGVSLRDTARAKQIFLNVAEQEGDEYLITEYQGVEIYVTEATIETELAGEDPSAIAFVDNMMVIGSAPEDIEVAIDVVAGRAPSAAENEQLKATTEQQDGDFVAWGYVDLGIVWDGLEDSFESQPDFDFGGQDYEELFDDARQSAERLSFVVSAHADGFTIDFSVFNSPDFVPGDSPAFAKEYRTKFASRVPASTTAFLSFYDFYSQAYLPTRDAIADISFGFEGDTLEELIEQRQNEIGIDFEGGLIELLNGEIGVAFDVSDLDRDPPSFSVLGLLDVDDPTAVRETLVDLGNYLTQEQFIDVEASADERIYRWTEAGGSDEGVAWTLVRDVLAISYPGETIQRFTEGVDESLADTSDWKRTMALLPNEITGLGYLSLSRLLDEARSVEGAEDGIRDAFGGDLTFDDLEPIRSIGFATANIEGGSITRMVILITE